MKYRECPICGAHLDPGERCDCQRQKEGPPTRPAKGCGVCQDMERGRPTATETTSRKELPSEVYQSTGQKSSRGWTTNLIMKGATT